ncbi:hypothetical protein [Streptomyces sp. NBC_00690]|uniref:hypothetical protein n=1 Tax=Streptomyces sp. NBC_00690 TaxID=2975808 RepID=UPI002E28EB0A|nr:hypothetical protein [Streptomyces sp. NBC_00690]
MRGAVSGDGGVSGRQSYTAAVSAYCTEVEHLAREVGDTEMPVWTAGTRSLGYCCTGRHAAFRVEQPLLRRTALECVATGPLKKDA